MSNGINAIKGFDYQATVILDRLFEHFDRDGPTARARPEGVDDLDLSWTQDAIEHRRYEQIKKPREDNQGNLKPRAWTLSEVVDLYRVIDEFAVNGAISPVSALPPAASQETASPPGLHLSYEDAVRALSGMNPDFKSAAPLVLDSVTKKQLEHLVLLAEPANDRSRATETFVPSVSFTPNGYTVAQRRVTTTNGGETAGTLIRPAIAAANRFGLNIPWHEELLTGVFATTYIPRFLASLVLRTTAAGSTKNSATKQTSCCPASAPRRRLRRS